MTKEVHPAGRSFQKPTTHSAVDGIRRAKFTRALSISAGDATRLGPSRTASPADIENARVNFGRLMPSTAERVVGFWKTRPTI